MAFRLQKNKLPHPPYVEEENEDRQPGYDNLESGWQMKNM